MSAFLEIDCSQRVRLFGTTMDSFRSIHVIFQAFRRRSDFSRSRMCQSVSALVSGYAAG